ncbi:MAG TPA: tripartite tricarboxylate transporter TctB family protein [Thermodesulfobacteriota bacterium]|nr:tripartite tricarboxylate transporter TctB family protein [Thermodesulfobacteriota bacterium]
MLSASAIVSLAALGMAAWAVLSATLTSWPWKTALFPLVIGTPVLVLATVELVLSLLGVEANDQGGQDLRVAHDVPPEVARRRVLAITAWIVAFFLLILGIGFILAVPAFVLAYLRLAGRERWPLSLGLAAVAWGLVYGVFDRLLHLPFAEGAVQGWLRTLGIGG